MVKIAFIVTFFLLAICGLCELIFAVRLMIFAPKNRFNTYLLLNLSSGDALLQLNYLYEKYKWYGMGYATAIIGVTDDLTSEEIIQCNQFTKGKNIFLCSSSEINNIL